jgi:hypothetical protein
LSRVSYQFRIMESELGPNRVKMVCLDWVAVGKPLLSGFNSKTADIFEKPVCHDM